MPRAETLQRWLNMPHACAYADMCRKTMRRLILAGEIRADRLGEGDKAHWRIDRESIDAYLDRTGRKSLATLEALGL